MPIYRFGEEIMEKYAGFIYEWTNKVTGMKYIGSHCGDKADYYIGSGNLFKKDVKQYGLLNYDRKILEYVVDESKIKLIENKWLEEVDAAHNKLYFNKTNKSSQFTRPKVVKNTIRPICSLCNQRPRAVAYHRNDNVYYRSRCTTCIRKDRKLPIQKARWVMDGYKKKTVCDRCGFRSRWAAQLLVFHIDGNLNNTGVRNLKTICQNCVVDVRKADLPWRAGDLAPDS